MSYMYQYSKTAPIVLQARSTLMIFPYTFIYLSTFMIKSVVMPTYLIENAKRPRAVMTLETKLKITANSEAEK